MFTIKDRHIIFSSKRIVKLIMIWFTLNTLVGLIIAGFLSIGNKYQFTTLLCASEITTHLIATPCIMAGYSLGYALIERKVYVILIILLIINVPVAFTGMLISYKIVTSMYSQLIFTSLIDFLTRIAPPIFILTVLITIIGQSIEYMWYNKIILNNELTTVLHTRKNHKTSGLNVKDGYGIKRVKYDEIIYISSHKKKCVIHTESKDYEIPKLIKELESQIPSDIFLRTHKQFIINISYVSRVQSCSGGRYITFLHDNDESIIPVGKFYVPKFKTAVRL
jgi:DNA-binding LytR/AlgR family response regulator